MTLLAQKALVNVEKRILIFYCNFYIFEENLVKFSIKVIVYYFGVRIKIKLNS